MLNITQAHPQVVDLHMYKIDKETVRLNAKSFLRCRTPETAQTMRESALAVIGIYGLSALNFPNFRITIDRGDIYISAPSRRGLYYGT